MQTLVIDTNGIVKKLEQRGFSRTQAEGITEALKELDTTPVSKSDLDDAVKTLQVAMRDQAIGMIKWVTGTPRPSCTDRRPRPIPQVAAASSCQRTPAQPPQPTPKSPPKAPP